VSIWTIYKRAGEWDDVIEGPNADGLTVCVLDDSFDGLMHLAQLILDRHYPADIFNTENLIVGTDPGTQLVVALRRCADARALPPREQGQTKTPENPEETT
jgi:hypothetical protein